MSILKRRARRGIVRGISALRVTIRKRLQDRRSGTLHGSVPGMTSRFRSRIKATSAGLRRARRR